MSQKQNKKFRRGLKVAFRDELAAEIKRRRDEQLRERQKVFMRGGLVDEKLKVKDFIFEKAFPKDEEVLGGQEIKPLGRLEQIRELGVFSPPHFQGQTDACVVVSAINSNQYYSHVNSNNKVRLNWEWVFEKVPKYQNGTKPSEILEFLRKNGVPEYGKENAGEYKIKGYYKLFDKSPQEVYRALQKAPCMIGFNAQAVGLSEYPFLHEELAIDTDGENWLTVSSWNPYELEIHKVPISVSLVNCILVYDRPDGLDVKTVRLGRLNWMRQYL